MLCRALLTAVAVSYLLCVLWLSGIQKEDLDVNMLTKLHRHNVSIENMNNETLRKACSYRGDMNTLNITQNVGDATIKASRSIDDRHHVSEQNITDSKVNRNFHENQNKNKEVKPVETNRQTEFHTPMILHRTTYQDDKNEYSVNTLKNNIAQKTALSLDKDQLYIKNIMKFWQTIASNMPKNVSVNNVDSMTTTDSYLRYSTLEPVLKISTTQSMEDMLRAVAEYISKRAISTTEAPITRDKDLKIIYRNLIANMNYKNAPIMPKDEVQQDKVRLNLLYNMDPDTDNVVYQSPIFLQDKVLTENLNPQKTGSMERVLKLHNQYKIYAPIYLYPSNFTNIPYKIVSYTKTNKTELASRRYINNLSESHQTSDENKTSGNINVNRTYQIVNTETNTNDNIKIDKTNKNLSPIISKDVLREIVNTVRDNILKDLKKELTSSSPNTTTALTPIFSITTTTATTKTLQTTTTKITTFPTTTTKRSYFNKSKTAPSSSVSEFPQTPNLYNMSSETKQVLDGFLKLFFDQVNAVHKTTIITHDANYKMTNMRREYFNVTNGAESMPTSVKSRENEVPKGENFEYPTNRRHSRIMQPPMFDFTPQEREPFKKLGQVEILQTNSNEIAPIGVPLAKPLKLVHHVEVVTSDYRDDLRDRIPEVPLRTKVSNNYHNERYYDNAPNRYDYQDYGSTRLNNRERYYKGPGYDYKQNYREVQNNPQRRDIYNNNYKEIYTNRYPPKVVDMNPKLSNSFDEMFSHKSSGKPKQVDFDNNRMKHKNRVKFHEKLEMVTDSLSASEEKQMADKQRFKVQVASRQQMPLNGMKKGYSDEHFKNFLKTQQKVNDMLERILSTKSKSENDLPLIESV